MPASYGNRLKCQSTSMASLRAAGALCAGLLWTALLPLTAAQTGPGALPAAPGTPVTHPTPDNVPAPNLPANAKAHVALLATPPAPTTPTAPMAGDGAGGPPTPGGNGDGDGGPAGGTPDAGAGSTGTGGATAHAAWNFEQFATAAGVYVLDTRTGTVETVTAEGQRYGFAFAGLETAPAGSLRTVGRFSASLVAGALFVLDRDRGVLERIRLSDLTRAVMVAAGGGSGGSGPVTGPNGAAGGTAGSGSTGPNGSTGPVGPNGNEHLAPPPTYGVPAPPAKLTDADRKQSQRDIDDYSDLIGYPYMGHPVAHGYELDLTVANKGKRLLAALECTVECRDPDTGKTITQRLYFRRNNGTTDAPPAPGKEIDVTITLPTTQISPVISVNTTYLAFGD